MTITNLTGTIERRLLINYRVDPAVAARILPPPFTPTLVNGYAIAGICLIDLALRPPWLPGLPRLRSLNGAHRVAVTLPDGSDAVYIPRRDTNSRLNVLVGGRLFPGPHHLAALTMRETDTRLSVDLSSRDGSTYVHASVSRAEDLPEGSVFGSIQRVSDFFEQGSIGYSDTSGGDCYDGLELRTDHWSVVPVHAEHVESSFFDDHTLFPAGSATFDNALLMRGIPHSWHAQEPLRVGTTV